MKPAEPKSRLGSEFDRFLFSPLGDDRNGLPVSVISLLARLNLDPWQEAGELAALSREAASKRLASSLDTLKDTALRHANSEALVLRLLALLPRRVTSGVVAAVTGSGGLATTHHGTRIIGIVFITSAIFLIGSQIFAAHRHAASPPAGAGPAPAVPVPAPPRPAAH